jgi:hypothetical protein
MAEILEQNENSPGGHMANLTFNLITPKVNLETREIIGVEIPVQSLPSEFSAATSRVGLEKIFIPFNEGEEYVGILNSQGEREPYIRVEGKEYPLAVYMNVRKERNRDFFKSFNPELGDIYADILSEYPELLAVNVVSAEPNQPSSYDYYKNNIYINEGDFREPNLFYQKLYSSGRKREKIERYEYLSGLRNEASTRVLAGKLEISVNELRNNALYIILFHEIGHAIQAAQYIKIYGHKGGLEKIQSNWEYQQTILSEHQIRRMDKEILSNPRLSKDIFYDNAIRQREFKIHKIYRELPMEELADQFMIKFYNQFKNRLNNIGV